MSARAFAVWIAAMMTWSGFAPATENGCALDFSALLREIQARATAARGGAQDSAAGDPARSLEEAVQALHAVLRPHPDFHAVVAGRIQRRREAAARDGAPAPVPTGEAARAERVAAWREFLSEQLRGGWREVMGDRAMVGPALDRQSLADRITALGRISEGNRRAEDEAYLAMRRARDERDRHPQGSEAWRAADEIFQSRQREWRTAADITDSNQRALSWFRMLQNVVPHLENGNLVLRDVVDWRTLKENGGTRSDFEEFTRGFPILLVEVINPPRDGDQEPFYLNRTFGGNANWYGYMGIHDATVPWTARDTIARAQATPWNPGEFVNDHTQAVRLAPPPGTILAIGGTAPVRVDPETGAYDTPTGWRYLQRDDFGHAHGGGTQAIVVPASFTHDLGLGRHPDGTPIRPPDLRFRLERDVVRQTLTLGSATLRDRGADGQYLIPRPVARGLMDASQTHILPIFDTMLANNRDYRHHAQADPRDGWLNWPTGAARDRHLARLRLAAAEASLAATRLEASVRSSGLPEARQREMLAVIQADVAHLNEQLRILTPPGAEPPRISAHPPRPSGSP